MKTPKYKIVLHMLVSIVISFALIYLMVFFGGWRLIESGDPILIEIAVAIVVGILVGILFEYSQYCESKFRETEKRIEQLEKRIEELRNS